MKKIAFILLIFLGSDSFCQQQTYCNPMNLDYGYTPIPNFSEWGRHRATADPVIVNYKGMYLLFSTNQWGYWYSKDLSDWTYVSHKFLRPRNKVYDELCAPAVGIVGDTVLVFGSTYTSEFTLWGSTDPMNNKWFPLVENFEIGGWDPDFFTDTDGRLYMYNGSSNVYPLYGIELDRKTFEPIGTRKELFLLQGWRYGWQRFGEHMDNTFLDAFMEGAHMTKHKGKYYLQYAGPGTEISGYADGVAVGDSPLGPFRTQSDPLSMKIGGFARGAGHGATFKDNWGNYWHVSSIMLSVKNNFERRLGFWPAGFDKDDTMYCNTAFGDYPHYLPSQKANHLESQFTGWMLLNYNKPVEVSSILGGFMPNNAVDENMKTYWSAKSGNPGEWFVADLGEVSEVRAIQINYADQDVDSSFLGKVQHISHKYEIYISDDKEHWELLIDKSKNEKDVPHDYVELVKPVHARYLKMVNVAMPSGKFALSGFRVFGHGTGKKPEKVKQFFVLRTEKDKRSGWIKWSPMSDAFAYNIYYGTDPDKLYNCIMVYSNNEYWFAGMDSKKTYYYTIEAINENGVSERYEIQKVE
ncbi:family 43 glycosylhydrolase [Marinilongibacter aquaticus]|uniref:family 43 glycosylhydrolase n=1 Tax=Marinilongibacter aquaticus TaxID=2975157 RepID=UPI0021BD7F71|nr:family 43 glycosylhydrolase [Marinilongibacter aquaticus]UBM57518.1 family 43 glycosylhydrolase [Marinilongibacter aquaticus]